MKQISATIDYLTASPQRMFWALMATHLVLWTMVPSLFSPNLPLDTIEGYAWGKEWLIGTHKHPPMQAWILEILFDVTGRARFAPYLASQVAVVTAFWAVWQTGRRIADDMSALIGVLLLEGIIYYNFTSPEFNPNVLQLPFWALAGMSFHKAVKDNKLVDWALCGLWAACGLYSKYSTVLFLATLGFAMLAHRDGRKRLLSPGPYFAVGLAFMLFLPHLMWLIHNDFIPWQYTQGRFERCSAECRVLITTALMVAGQLLALLACMILMITLYDRRRAPCREPAASFDRIFLICAAFGPFITTFIMSLFLGYHIRDMWETPFWNFLGLWMVVFLRPSLMPQDLRRFAMAWILVFMTGFVAFIANESLSPYATQKPKRTIFPGKRLSQTIIDDWHNRYHMPLAYVLGDTWPAGNIAWYADDRPHVIMDGDMKISPWIDHVDFKKQGGVYVWCIQCGSRMTPDQAELVKGLYPTAIVQQPLTLRRMTYADVPPAIIGWAVIPPQP